MKVRELTLNYEKDTINMLMGGKLGIEERLLLMQVEGHSKDEIIKDLQERIENTSDDAEGEMAVLLAEGLIKKLMTQDIDISKERALGNPFEE